MAETKKNPSKFNKIMNYLSFGGKDAMEDKEKIVDSMSKIKESKGGGMFGEDFQKSIDPETLQRHNEAAKEARKKRNLQN